MTTVCEKGKCTGCMECIDICPKQAIQMVDTLVEYNAEIDSEKCIHCNACHSACQNYEHNWRFEINKWKTVSYNFTTKCLVLHDLKFSCLKYGIQAAY